MSESKLDNTTFHKVVVKLIGVLASAAGQRELELETPEHATVSDVVSILLKRFDKGQFRELLVDSATGDTRPNVIILLNDQDCNVFDGLKTEVQNGSVVTVIPVAHGG